MTYSGTLTIDLSAIQANWMQLSQYTNSDVDVAAVVKANAYGLGVKEVSRALYEVGCREFFVATTAEAVEFKSYCLTDTTLYVLGGVPVNDEEFFICSGFIPVLFSLEAVQRWAKVCALLNISAPCVIKIDTGMTRLGLSITEFNSICDDEGLLKKITLLMVMSHLACADEPDHPLNFTQLKLFNRCVERIKIFLPHLRFSLANSSGIFLGKDWHFNLLRPGAALYGINPTSNKPNRFAPVIKLTLPIIQIRVLDVEASVGYAASSQVKKGARLAAVAGGYADGVHRTLGLQPEGYLDNTLVRATGRISMDTTVFDISNVNLPETELINKSIEVICSGLTLDYLMKKNKTLGYDVLTSLGSRYQRAYLPGQQSE